SDDDRRRSGAGKGLPRRAHRRRSRSVESGAGLMLFHLLYPFHTQFSVLNVTRYITFRTAAASLSALAISLALGPWMVRKLREFQIGQVIRQEGPQTHRAKSGTPTMGGVLILTAALVPTVLWADLTNVYVWISVLQAGHPGSRLVVRAVRGIRPDGRIERGESDRRARRTGDQHLHDRGHGVHGPCVRRGQPRPGRVPAAHALFGRGRADRVLRL